MAYAAVILLLEDLKDLLNHRKTLIQDAEPELRKLDVKLEELKCLLETEPKHKHFLEETEDAVYALEDIIDYFITQSLLSKTSSIFSRSRSGHRGTKILEKIGLRNHHGFGADVQNFLDDKLTPMIEKFKKKREDDPATTANESPPATKSHETPLYTGIYKVVPQQDKVIGLEDEMDTLIDYLHQQAEEFEVISITGRQGMGKTTMARRIFQHSKIQKEFPTRIWVNVSEELNMMHVLINIMKAFTKQNMSNKTLGELSELVPKYLEMGKFLLILDDVRTCEVWKQIREVFPLSKTKKGKILITTCDENVATASTQSESKALHQLRLLNKDESWELLRFQVFGRMGNCSPELESVGRRIAENCNGFPLSLTIIGGILFNTSARREFGDTELQKEWERIAEPKSPEDIIPLDPEALIRRSYETLPHDLRDCFLYLGIFPADTEILASKLTHLWLAEGFVRKGNRTNLEEAAKENLMELIGRNLLMVERIKVGGEVKVCRVHDTIRRFCITEAGIGKHKLYQEIKIPSPSPGEYHDRRLFIHSHVKEFLSGKPDISKVRSFLFFSKLPIRLGPEDIEYVGHTFSMARVLEAIDIQLPQFPRKLTRLVHLRYITLSCNEFNILPEAISNLWYLQTLIVETSSQTLEVRANIWKMMHLRYLKTKASIILLKKGDGNGGENLQILTRLSPESLTEDVYNKAKNLFELGIRGILSDTLCLEKLLSLERLTLQHDVYRGTESKNPLAKLPRAFPPKLRYLVLSGTCLGWECISQLAKLGTLQVLKLKENAFTGDSWDVVDGEFESLEALSINQAELKFWTASVNSFPKLRTLELEKCEKLQEIPVKLGETLETLSLYRVTRFAISYAKKIEEGRAIKGGFKLQIYRGDI